MLYLMFRWLFVTEEDIKGLPCFQVSLSHMEVIGKKFEFLNIEMLLRSNCCVYILYHQNETLIAIKAPHGTTLEVPDPDEVI